MRPTKHPKGVKCQICSKVFQTVCSKAKYCPYCQVFAQSTEKAALYKRYMTEGRKCLYCNKHFMPAVPDQRFCSEKCEHKRKTNVDKCNERHKKDPVNAQLINPTPRPKYKSPINSREQEQLNIEVRKKISPPFDPGRKLTPEEIRQVMPQITPIDKIPHRSRPNFTYGAAFGGER